jgi:hypothetical protein
VPWGALGIGLLSIDL